MADLLAAAAAYEGASPLAFPNAADLGLSRLAATLALAARDSTARARDAGSLEEELALEDSAAALLGFTPRIAALVRLHAEVETLEPVLRAYVVLLDRLDGMRAALGGPPLADLVAAARASSRADATSAPLEPLVTAVLRGFGDARRLADEGALGPQELTFLAEIARGLPLIARRADVGPVPSNGELLAALAAPARERLAALVAAILELARTLGARRVPVDDAATLALQLGEIAAFARALLPRRPDRLDELLGHAGPLGAPLLPVCEWLGELLGVWRGLDASVRLLAAF